MSSSLIKNDFINGLAKNLLISIYPCSNDLAKYLRIFSLYISLDVLNKYSFDLRVRAERLSLEVFVEIANVLVNKN